VAGFMVRLEDGSEVGPLETDMVRRWYEQGLINSKSLVLPPGSTRWEKLGAVVDVQAWGGYAEVHRRQVATKARLARARRESDPAAAPPADEPRLRTRLLGALCLAVAAAMAAAAFAPDRLRAEFAGLPWKELALGMVACGLALVPGFPLGALLFAQGLFLLLARGPLHWAIVGSGLLLTVGGLAVAIRFLLPG